MTGASVGGSFVTSSGPSRYTVPPCRNLAGGTIGPADPRRLDAKTCRRERESGVAHLPVSSLEHK